MTHGPLSLTVLSAEALRAARSCMHFERVMCRVVIQQNVPSNWIAKLAGFEMRADVGLVGGF